MNNIMCVKWGALYGPEFVNRLYGMVKRNLTAPFRFICLTDDPSGLLPEVETFPIDTHLKGWWPKVQYFKTPLFDIEGPVLALDLDLIIVDNIDCFFDFCPMNFCMKADFPTHGHSSVVMRFDANGYGHIYDNLDLNIIDHAIDNSAPKFKDRKYWGDQIWITEQMTNHTVKLWPSEWIVKYGKQTTITIKHKKQFNIPKDCKIIVWAGYKNDQRRYLDIIKKYWVVDEVSSSNHTVNIQQQRLEAKHAWEQSERIRRQEIRKQVNSRREYRR